MLPQLVSNQRTVPIYVIAGQNKNIVLSPYVGSLRRPKPPRPPRPTVWGRPDLTLKETIQNLMEFFFDGHGSGFGGFGPNFGTIDAFHKDRPLTGGLGLDSAYKVEVEALDAGDFGGMVRSDVFNHLPMSGICD